jgi:hypothetical protein
VCEHYFIPAAPQKKLEIKASLSVRKYRPISLGRDAFAIGRFTFPLPQPPYIGAWQAMAYEYLNAADMNWQADLQNTNLMNPIK